MGNIIQFPAKAVRDNVSIEKCIKDILENTPVNEDIKNAISKRCSVIFSQYQCEFSPSFNLSFPASSTKEEQENLLKSIEQGFRDFENSLHDHMNVLIFERVQTEIKLYFIESPI